MSRHVLNALLIAGGIVAGAAGLAYLAGHGFIPADKREMATRAFNLTTALILLWWANLAPKRLRPLAELTCDRIREQRARRVAGVALIVAGLISAVAWLIAPFNLALPVEATAIGGGLAIVFVRRFSAGSSWGRD
jgi:hypothetical protein